MRLTDRDFLVDTSNPEALDRTLNGIGAALVGGDTEEGYQRVDGHYVVRCLADPGFIRFAVEHQGYAKIAPASSLDKEL